MTIHKSVKLINLNKHRQALYDRIRRLGIKCLVSDWSDYKDNSDKAMQDGYSTFRISDLNRNSQVATKRSFAHL